MATPDFWEELGKKIDARERFKKQRNRDYNNFINRIIGIVAYYSSDYQIVGSRQSDSVYIYVDGIKIRCSDHKQVSKMVTASQFEFLFNSNFSVLELRKRLKDTRKGAGEV
jgi:hypothetical protein